LYSIVFILLLLSVSLILIGYPIWKGRREEGDQAGGLSPFMATNEREKSQEKDIIMGTLSEIEFDYHMKKLSEEDYRVLKNKYAKMAMEILEEEDANLPGDQRSSKTESDNLDEIEREIEAELQAFEKGGF